MSWRTVVITNRCKLDLSMGYMVVRSEETKRIFIDEIAIVIIENPAVSITGCLLTELARRKVRVIFCDEKRSPYGELQPYIGSHDSSSKIRTQIAWSDERKKAVWTQIVTEKIRNQAELLYSFDYITEGDLLSEYIEQIEFGDTTNREGHAAKVYFNALFGKDFSRGQENAINASLNYGYSLILSAFNRTVCANGYLTQIGIFHDNMFNAYNFSCDLMEPFRVIVDNEVLGMHLTEFNRDLKYRLISLLNETYVINGSEQSLINTIKIYSKSVFDAINDNDLSLIRFAKLI